MLGHQVMAAAKDKLLISLFPEVGSAVFTQGGG